MSEMKRCKQCGVLKSADAFRRYTYSRQKGTEGRFRICRQCENINTTYRRLLTERRTLWNEADERYGVPASQMPYYNKLVSEIEKIEQLYALLEAHGYSTPVSNPKTDAVPAVVPSTIDTYVDSLSSFYGATPSDHKKVTEQPVSTKPTAPALQPEELDVPNDLKRWLEMSMEDFAMAGLTPDYLQETVYESLKAKYRPQVGTDPQTFLPTYDDTYKPILNRILKSFDDYEDYWALQSDEESYDNGIIPVDEAGDEA